jgi:hypothetical protein
MNKSELPFKLRIASPCPARWEDMGGDDRIRFCDQCKKNVYNLSAMTTAEATEIIASNPGRLCARIYQRADGTVLTEDCPVGVARHWRRIKRRVAGAIAALAVVVMSTAALARDRGQQPNSNALRDRVLTAMDSAQWTVKGWFGIQKPPPTLVVGRMLLTGKVAPTVTVGQLPQSQILIPPPANK